MRYVGKWMKKKKTRDVIVEDDTDGDYLGLSYLLLRVCNTRILDEKGYTFFIWICLRLDGFFFYFGFKCSNYKWC